MVWAGISFYHRTPLDMLEENLTALCYISDVLEEHAIPFVEQHPNLRIFQHDNARPHSAMPKVYQCYHGNFKKIIRWYFSLTLSI